MAKMERIQGVAATTRAAPKEGGGGKTFAIVILLLFVLAGVTGTNAPVQQALMCYSNTPLPTIPLFPAMTRADVVRVVEVLTTILRTHQKS